MAHGLGIRLGDLAAPFAVGEDHGRLRAALGGQLELGVGHARPGAGLGDDTGVLLVVVIGDGIGAVGVNVHMTAEPEVSQLIELHAAFGADLVRGGGDGLRGGRGLFGRGGFRTHRRLRGCGGLLNGAALLLDRRRPDRAEPAEDAGEDQHSQHDEHAHSAELFILIGRLLEEDQQHRAEDDRVEKGDEAVPVRSVVRFDLHGGGVGLGVKDVVAGRAHRLARRVVGAVDARAHQAEHHVVARAHREIRIHPGGVRHGGVGHNHADKAPLAAQHVGDQRLRAAGPGRAEVGVARHDGRGLALLDGDLKGLEIELAHRLFIAPDREGETVGFLIVQGEMLGVAVDALARRAAHLRRTELAGEQTILRVVLEVAAGEGRAVDVHAGGIETDDAVCERLGGKDAAELLDQRRIPGRADDRLTREGHALERADEGVDAGGAVEIGGGGLADGGHGGRRPAAVEDHGRHILIAELLEQQFPLGIVPGEPGEILEHEAVVGVDDRGVGVVDLIGGLLGERLHHEIGGCLTVRARARRGARPVGAGDVDGDLPVLHIGKMRDGGGLIGGARIALAVDDRVLHGISPAVDDLMRVFHQLDRVVAGLEHIAARAEGVEGSHILGCEGHRHGLGLARGEELRLGEAREHDLSLLHAALGIGRGVVDLHDVLTRDRAGVCDLDLHGDDAVAVGIALDALLKVRIAQTVAKGVLHGAVIVDKAVGRGGLIVAVADIDALGVLDIVAGLEVAVSKVPGVPEGGGGGEVIGVGIDQAAGGIDRAGQRLTNRVEADRAGAADPERGVHAVLEEAELHRVGGVDEHDGLREALRLHEREQVFLVLRQLEIVPSVVGLAVACGEHILRQVAALAADAGEHDDRGVGEVLRLLQHRLGVGGGGNLGRSEVGAGIAALLRAGDPGVPVEFHELLVDLKPGILQALDDVHIRGGVARAAARAAVDRIDRAVAEEVDLAAGCERKRAVFVPEQHKALCLETFGHCETLRRGVRDGQDIGALDGLGAGQQGIEVDAHPGSDHGVERSAGDIHRQRGDQQDRQKDYAAFFHAVLLLLFTGLDKGICNMIISTQC